MMKICVLSGSPRKHGNTMKLVERFVEGAMQSGNTAEIFDVTRMDIHPCMGCMACKKRDSGCVQHDDMEKIYESVKASDILVFATPMYWWNFSGPLKTAIDRLFALPFNIRMGGHALEGKSLRIIVTSGQESSRKLESVLENIGLNMCEYTGMNWLGIISAGNTGGKSESGWAEALEKAREAGSSLHWEAPMKT